MINMSRMTNEEIIEKHAKTPEEIEQDKIVQQEAPINYIRDVGKVEQNLQLFLQKTYPMIDPQTNLLIGWVKQISVKELMEITPESLVTAARDGLSPDEVAKELGDDLDTAVVYELMARMIVTPTKTSDEWAKLANPDLINLFQKTVVDMYTDTENQVRFF